MIKIDKTNIKDINEESKEASMFLVAIVIILLIVFYLASLGKLNPAGIGKLPDELKESIEKAKHRHKKIMAVLETQHALKTKLNKRFRTIYFFIRLGFVLLWAAFLVAFYFFGLVKNLGDGLNYSEALVLALIAVNFLTFGTISNLEKFIEVIKIKTENWIYGKHKNLNQKIEKYKIEDKELIKTIQELDSSEKILRSKLLENTTKDNIIIEKVVKETTLIENT
jgi:hypothetical protein